jgi:flagellar FliJ protein
VKKSGRVQRLANLSATAEQISAQALARATEEVSRLERQIGDLQGYRDEYLRPLHEAGATAVGGYQVQKLRLFVGRIEEALALIERKKKLAEINRERERAVWMAQRRRALLMNKVAQRARTEEEAYAERTLQREIDDRPSRP